MAIFPLKHLVKAAIHRAHITRQVSAHEIVRFANDLLVRLAPTGHPSDARATSYKDQVLSIYVLHSSARQALVGSEQDLLTKLRVAFPEKVFQKLSIRVSKRFPNEEV